MSASGLPGKRVEANRAGMTATTCRREPESTASPVDEGCTANHNTIAKCSCYDPTRMQRVQSGPRGQRVPRVHGEQSRGRIDWTRVAVLAVLGGTLVTLLARASTSPTPSPVVPPPPAAVEDTASLFTDVDRLRARLRPPVDNAIPSRNLFAFRRVAPVAPRRIPVPSEAVAATPIPAVTPATRTSPLSLIGLAENAGPPGLVRTAILSGAGGLHFVEVDAVVAGFRVSAIRDDAVELTAVDGAESGTPIVLTFK